MRLKIAASEGGYILPILFEQLVKITTTMNIFYIIWLAIPTLYFLIALWGYLEKKGKSHARQNPQDFFKQGFFILLCSLATIGIDYYILIDWQNSLPEFLPLTFARILLLPIVFLVLGIIVGGSKKPSLKQDKKGKR